MVSSTRARDSETVTEVLRDELDYHKIEVEVEFEVQVEVGGE